VDARTYWSVVTASNRINLVTAATTLTVTVPRLRVYLPLVMRQSP
jgi:hypothetical protein